MKCLQCGFGNQGMRRRCGSCGQVLEFIVPSLPTEDGIPLKEGVEYLDPSHHYATEDVDELLGLVDEVVQGRENGEELSDYVEAFCENFETFMESNARPLSQALLVDAHEQPDEPFPFQLDYVLHTASRLLSQGKATVQETLELDNLDPEKLEEGAYRLGEAYDYLYFALELIDSHLED